MDATAKRELATAILETRRIREASHIQGTFHYAMDYEEAARRAKVDPDLVPLIISMLVAGYCDFPEWAEQIVAQRKAA